MTWVVIGLVALAALWLGWHLLPALHDEVPGTAAGQVRASKGNDAPSTYFVGLVGEASYQPAIKRCREGQAVELRHEPGNAYDPEAIVAISTRGETIGYLPREHWAQRVMLKESKRVNAVIAEITGGAGRKTQRGVVLRVTVGRKAEAA